MSRSPPEPPTAHHRRRPARRRAAAQGPIDRPTTARDVGADSACRSTENEGWLADQGMVGRIQRSKHLGRPMPARTRRDNGRRSAARSQVAHVFAHQKARMGLTIRTTGTARAKAAVTLSNVAFDMTRWRWLGGRTGSP